MFYRKICSHKFCNIYRKAPVLECLLNGKRLQHRFFSVNIVKFRTPILKNICERLLLWVAIIFLRKQHFIFLLLLVRFAWLLSIIYVTPCRKQLCFHDRFTKFISCILPISLDQNVSILFVSNIFWEH